jgi:Cysteine-rich secretory protein family
MGLLRVRFLMIAAVAVALGVTGSTPKALGQQGSPAQLLQLLNQERANAGQEPLAWDNALAEAAQQHAEWMARGGALSHQYSGEADLAQRAAQSGVHFQTIAENIALGDSPRTISTEWMNSPPHRANVHDPRLNAVGIAIVNKDGSLYAAADFAREIPNLTPQQVEDKIISLLSARGITAGTDRQDARQSCEMEHGSAGGTHPMFVMRWEGSVLNRLPDALEQRISTGKYKTAAVGACTSANPQQAFASYRIAVLLYY